MAHPAGQPVVVHRTLDGQPLGDLTIDRDTLYPLLDGSPRAGGRLELEFGGPVEVFALTFG